MRLNLREIPFFVPVGSKDFEKRSRVITLFRRLGINIQCVPAVICEPQVVGRCLSVLKILTLENVSPPFGILSDVCAFKENLKSTYDLPGDTDVLYLSQSRFGIQVPGEFSWGKFDQIELELYSRDYVRFYNNLAAHAIVIISSRFHDAAIESHWSAVADQPQRFPSSVAFARLQKEFLALSPVVNPSYQVQEWGGHQSATINSLWYLMQSRESNDVLLPSSIPNEFLFSTRHKNEFFLFFDLFVHWTKRKITAVAPYYGDDLDLMPFYEQIDLSVGDFKIRGQFIPCRLDSWEPSILIDFEHPGLEKLIRDNKELKVLVECNGLQHAYTLYTTVPRHQISMSLIVKNENKWLPVFLEYYLDILKADHIYLYDNGSDDKTGLYEIVRPKVQLGTVTLIPWPYRWRNAKDKKQIGQPPHQAHTLNKYGSGKWIGFFDIDEFLNLPGKTLPGYMQNFDPTAIGGVSFGLKWFFYKGSRSLDEIQNPLQEFIYSKPDKYGRKKQKLMVSPFCCRYLRFHWIPDDQKEIQIDEEEAIFHHYCIREKRFEEGKSDEGLIDRSLAWTVEEYEMMKKWTHRLDSCFEKAGKGISRLTEDALKIEGMIGRFTRHFYNNLGSYPGIKILEIGLWKGASSCSFLCNNWIQATFIDNWSEFRGPEEICKKNIRKYSGPSRVMIIKDDCFEIDLQILDKFNVFVYDGGHTIKAHYQAIKKFYGCLEDIAIVIIDDWNWETVRKGTFKAIEDLRIPIFYEKQILLNEEDLKDMPRHQGKNSWWNGLFVFGINKNLKV